MVVVGEEVGVLCGQPRCVVVVVEEVYGGVVVECDGLSAVVEEYGGSVVVGQCGCFLVDAFCPVGDEADVWFVGCAVELQL